MMDATLKTNCVGHHCPVCDQYWQYINNIGVCDQEAKQKCPNCGPIERRRLAFHIIDGFDLWVKEVRTEAGLKEGDTVK